MNNPLRDPEKFRALLKRVWDKIVMVAKIAAGLGAIHRASKLVWEALHTLGVL
ncbi:hypothetical protein [Bradyrhizobium sp. S69]|uniref:hypothetical protein n=1 Tax=Bradyrhizobium sp. S69 TaxID=1641856 RepID=UPI00131A75E2|nr:hypothetical protein [Bradyrhizobium sp. S69]